jgi:hypothetical protein
MSNFILALVVMGLGLSMILWPTKFSDVVPFEWGAQFTGGSSSAAYQLLGVVLILIGMLILAGVI